jgi:hypothetical protein
LLHEEIIYYSDNIESDLNLDLDLYSETLDLAKLLDVDLS